MTRRTVELRDVLCARRRIRSVEGLVRRTPLVEAAPPLARRLGCDLRLKLETLQPTSAFKVRGAASKLLALDPAERARGVVTLSTGNHGRAVAHVGRRLGVSVTVCLARNVSRDRIEAIEALGAEVIVAGDSQDEAGERALALCEERGATLVHPFDDPHVIAGQGTLALEILEDLPEIDTCLVPLSGGGLISGIAVALKAASPRIRVVGISMQGGAAMIESLVAGEPVAVREQETLAESLKGGIGLDNRYTFQICRDLVDATVTVSEDAIRAAMRALLYHQRLLVEGAAAVGIAALDTGAVAVDPAERVVTVLSGANTAPAAWLLEESSPAERAPQPAT